MNYIGIDLGTSSVKLLLMNDDGKIIRTVSKEYEVFYPANGWSEQRPQDWYRSTLEGLKELLISDEDRKVAGLSVAGQMHGLVVLDEDDNVIRNAILWNDGRSQTESDWLNNEITTRTLTELTGNISYAGFTAPKLLWMRKHEPENFSRIRKIMLPKDYLIYKLTGAFVTDPSDASGTLYFDVKNRRWSEKMCDILGISIAQLPKIHESYEAVGTLLPEIRASLGITNDVVVAAGAGDNAGAAIGMGVTGEGRCNISLGTSGTIFVSSEKYCEDYENKLHSFAHADGGYHVMGCILSAASCNKWWLESILGTSAYNLQMNKIDRKRLGKNNVIFLPYLMGERSPINDTSARAVFFGMSMDNTGPDMTQAVLEGVAFALKDCLVAAESSGIRVKSSLVCGGGAKSKIWLDILANVLGIRLVLTDNTEGPSYGAAILAAVAAGRFENVRQACESLIRVSDDIEPNEELTRLYEKRYEEYKRLYPALKETFRNIQEKKDE